MKTLLFRSWASAVSLATVIFVTVMVSVAGPAFAETESSRRELDVLERVYPNWKSIVKSRDFALWLVRQSPAVKELWTSKAAVDAIELLDRYTKDGRVRSQASASAEEDSGRVLLPFKNRDDRTLSPSEVFERTAGSTFVIHAEFNGRKSQGSAVVVGDLLSMTWGTLAYSPILVTNAHVVRDTIEVILTQDSIRLAGRVIYIDPSVDLAFIEMSPMKGARSVSINSARRLRTGDAVYAVGAPLGLERTLTGGLVSAIRVRNGVKEIQTSASISPGSSGGGLFDDKGRLVGITTYKARGGENINFAIDGELVYDIRESLRASRALRFLYFDDDLKSLRESSERGDIVRWLWKTNISPTGKQAYQFLFDILGSNADTDSNRRDAEREGLLLILRTLKESIHLHPLPTPRELRGGILAKCEVRMGDRSPFGAHFFVDLDAVRIILRADSFPYKSIGDQFEWIDNGRDPLQWRYSPNTRSVTLRVVTDGFGYRQGEIIGSGTCVEVQ